jgi:hypothetical protein
VDDITAAIDGLTDRIIAYRVLLERGYIAVPLLEIKGLSQHIANAKKGISDVRNAAGNLSTETTALTLELQDVTKQVQTARDDLKFEADQLGNSPPQ